MSGKSWYTDFRSHTKRFWSEKAGPNESREFALHLIKNSQHIFIAYSHRDLKLAKVLYRKVLSLRKSRPPESVFIDEEAFRPGSTVSRRAIETRIRAANLVIVLCGLDTWDSREVSNEIELAIAERDRRGIFLLPIIASSAVHKLPSALDFRIQAIRYDSLFPARKWIVRLTVTSVVLLVAGLIYLYIQREREAINHRISLYDTEIFSPLSVAQAELLEGILNDATHLKYDKAREEARRRLIRYPLARAKQKIGQWKHPVGIVSSRNSATVLAAFQRELVFVGHRANLEEITVVPIERGNCVAVAPDPKSGLFLVELQFENFADPMMANKVANGRVGDIEVVGAERAVFRVTPDGKKWDLLGKTLALRLHTGWGPQDTEPPKWYARGTEGEIRWEDLMWFNNRLHLKYISRTISPRASATFLSGTTSGAVLYDVAATDTFSISANTQDQELFAASERFLLLLTASGEHVEPLGRRFLHIPGLLDEYGFVMEHGGPTLLQKYAIHGQVAPPKLSPGLLSDDSNCLVAGDTFVDRSGTT
jgi:hypothetical protein